MLLADWLSSRPERPAGWLGCDEADGDPFRFFAGLIEALRRASGDPGLGEDARQLLDLDGAVSVDVVAALTDDLEGTGGPEALVIDDFHLTGTAGAKALGLLVEHRPPSLQLVLATRLDPQLRLHRMRSYGQLVELRDRDLSFSPEETKRFLASFDVELDEPDVDLVHDRSEGWAAGLQMAAISIVGSPDPFEAARRVEMHRHTVARYSWTRSFTASLPKSSTSCWRRPSWTSCRWMRPPRSMATARATCSSTCTAPTCSSPSWTSRLVLFVITIWSGRCSGRNRETVPTADIR